LFTPRGGNILRGDYPTPDDFNDQLKLNVITEEEKQ
jgi:hypothetical protein